MITLGELQNKKNNVLILGVFFLSLAIILTIGLFFYNKHVEGKINKIGVELDQMNTSIKKLQDNKSIQVYNLLTENKKVLDEMTKKSRIKDYIYHVRSLERQYGITLKGFSYSNGDISMQATTPFNPNVLASNRVSHFISSYRENEKNPFTLEFINTFNGFDTISFGVNFKLK